MYSLSFSLDIHSLSLGQYLAVWSSKTWERGSITSLFKKYNCSFPEVSEITITHFSSCLRLEATMSFSCFSAAEIWEMLLEIRTSIRARHVLFARAEKNKLRLSPCSLVSALPWSVQTARMKCLSTWRMVLYNALDVVGWRKRARYLFGREKRKAFIFMICELECLWGRS